jgi:hypothetical protein
MFDLGTSGEKCIRGKNYSVVIVPFRLQTQLVTTVSFFY